ncbi:MAG: flagellin [Bdellovibrionales bacterium]
MAISEVSLTSSARANLTALQNTASLLETTQARLSSGKKVNSALDNASAYFASEGFINSANDLDTLKDSMSTALQTIQAATDAIESITTIVEQMKALVNSALQTTDATSRADYAAQYDDLRAQLDDLAADATFNGTNLVDSLSTTLTVNFNATNTTKLNVNSSDLTTSGMGVGASVGDWADGTLAQEIEYTMTVQESKMSNTTATLVTTEDLNLSVENADSNNGDGAVFTSTAVTALDGSDTVTTGVIATGADEVLGTNAFTALVTNGGLTAVYSVTHAGSASGTAGTTIEGQFTATGGSATAAALTVGAGATLTATATDGTGITYSLGVGETIYITVDDGTDDSVYVITNDSDAAITWTSGNAGDTVALQGTADSTLEYTLSSGDVSTTVDADGNALVLPTSGTLDGKNIVSSGGAAAGTEVTATVTSAAASGATAGTTSATGEIAYDLASATLNDISITTIRATMTNNTVSTTTYGAGDSGLTIDIENVTQLQGSSVTTIKDALALAQDQLTGALTSLRSAASSLGNNNTLVQTRIDFTESMISTLSTASDNLTLADTNEEGANLQALQAQSQLGIVALGISGEQAQAILRLF